MLNISAKRLVNTIGQGNYISNINEAKERGNCVGLLSLDRGTLLFLSDISITECQFKCHRSLKAVAEKNILFTWKSLCI